jgi:hypothetical protein
MSLRRLGVECVEIQYMEIMNPWPPSLIHGSEGSKTLSCPFLGSIGFVADIVLRGRQRGWKVDSPRLVLLLSPARHNGSLRAVHVAVCTY